MENKKIIKQKQGIIVSDKMNQTAVVLVERLVKHPLYKKYYRRHKKFKAHNPNNQYKEGDKVIIAETRPISKEKSWIIIGKVKDNKK